MSSKSESAEMQKDTMTADAAADEVASPDDGVEFSAGAEEPGVEELMQKLETLQGKADGYLNDLMRARAEAERRRSGACPTA